MPLIAPLTADWVALLDLLGLLDADLDDDTRHRGANGAGVVGSLLTRDGLDRRVLVLDRDGTNLVI